MIRQYHPYPTVKKTTGSDYRSAYVKKEKNKSMGQTTIRQEAPRMKSLWKRRWQEKTVSLRPW